MLKDKRFTVHEATLALGKALNDLGFKSDAVLVVLPVPVFTQFMMRATHEEQENATDLGKPDVHLGGEQHFGCTINGIRFVCM